jgi:hypothetical protein
MGLVLIAVGAIWGLLGVANFVGSMNLVAKGDTSTAVGAVSFVFNGFVFVLPGLALFAWGVVLHRRQSLPKPATAMKGPEVERLAALRDRGVLTEEEFQAQKTAVLQG